MEKNRREAQAQANTNTNTTNTTEKETKEMEKNRREAQAQTSTGTTEAKAQATNTANTTTEAKAQTQAQTTEREAREMEKNRTKTNEELMAMSYDEATRWAEQRWQEHATQNGYDGDDIDGYANDVIAEIDEEGDEYDDETQTYANHGRIDIAMEAWARDMMGDFFCDDDDEEEAEEDSEEAEETTEETTEEAEEDSEEAEEDSEEAEADSKEEPQNSKEDKEMTRANRVTVTATQNGYEVRFYRTHRHIATVSAEDTAWMLNDEATATQNREAIREWVCEHAEDFGILWSPEKSTQAWERKHNTYMTDDDVIEDAITLITPSLQRLADKCRYEMSIIDISVSAITPKDSNLSYVTDGRYNKNGAWCVADIEITIDAEVNGHEVEVLYGMEMKSGQICKSKTTIAEFNEIVARELELQGIVIEEEVKTA